jgi:hypothetical protein
MMGLPAVGVLEGKIQVKAIGALVRPVPNLMNKPAELALEAMRSRMKSDGVLLLSVTVEDQRRQRFYNGNGTLQNFLISATRHFSGL